MKGLILHESARGIDAYGPESGLLKSRMLFFTEEVTAESANELIEYLLFLDKDAPGEEITICINSPGGEVVSGLAVYDTIRMLESPVRTVCIGTAASMGSILFLAGEKRLMLPHCKIMIHDPLIAGLSGSKKALELEKEAAKLMRQGPSPEALSLNAAAILLKRCWRRPKRTVTLTQMKQLNSV